MTPRTTPIKPVIPQPAVYNRYDQERFIRQKEGKCHSPFAVSLFNLYVFNLQSPKVLQNEILIYDTMCIF